jgi:conjugal transfer pilin signal peptidase TrbI
MKGGLNPMQIKKWKRPTKCQVAVLCFVFLGLFLFLNKTKFMMNMSESLPHKAFLVLKGIKPMRGDCLTFTLSALQQEVLPTDPSRASQTQVFKTPVYLTKRVVGVAGDYVRREGDQMWVGDMAVGPLLKETIDGFPLTPLAFEGEIPEGHVFVAGEHERSFDSRYEEMGLVSENCFLGKAVPLF